MKEAVSFKQALLFWFKLGFISFGGPAGHIALMHQELVEKRRWISERRFLHALNYCMVLPGPEAQQLATYLGWLMHNTLGGVLAGVLFVLPSMLFLIVLGWIYVSFGQLSVIAAIFYGIKPAVTAVVLFAAYRIGSRALKNALLWSFAALAFLAIYLFNVAFPLIVLMAALLGALGGKFLPRYFTVSAGHGAANVQEGAAMIDDDTPLPAYAVFSWWRFFRVVVVCVLLWAAVFAVLYLTQGWNGVLTQMAWFFTKAAFLTFGGAYAVLPYVYQGAVEQYHWLTAAQMMDGLALGETTPGPLIMVVTFVGFLGGSHAGVAVLAAIVVTFFTFLPSFLFILAGAPLIESTHGNLKFTAPLTAITAAIVGVIINLAVFFAQHVLFLNQAFDVIAALITLAALIALFRYKVGVIAIIGGCAVLGCVLKLLL